MKKILKFLGLPLARKKLLVEALLMVAGVRIGLWVVPYRRLNTWLPAAPCAEASQTIDWPTIREAAAAVSLCSRFVPQATCLTQAIATQTLLGRRGLDSRLTIGVDKDETGAFLAHAWIEIEGKIVIGRLPNIRRYSVMSYSKEQLV